MIKFLSEANKTLGSAILIMVVMLLLGSIRKGILIYFEHLSLIVPCLSFGAVVAAYSFGLAKGWINARVNHQILSVMVAGFGIFVATLMLFGAIEPTPIEVPSSLIEEAFNGSFSLVANGLPILTSLVVLMLILIASEIDSKPAEHTKV